MIDTHAHVDGPRFDADRDATLGRAWAAGVRTFVNVGHDLASSERSVALAAADPRIFAAVGLHPHEAGRVGDAEFAALERLARAPRVVAIGECGLDRGPHNDAPFEAQERLFRRHVDLARRTGLPLVVHNRDTYPDLFRILDDESRHGALRGIMHCFSGGPDEADRSVELGFHLSFSGVLTFRNAERTRDAARRAPEERLLVETDCPYLAPEPRRGQRNEPAWVALTLARLAEVRGVSPAHMERVTDTNARRVFGLPPEEDAR